MKKGWYLDADMTIDEILRRWPSAIRALIDYNMLCIGCPIGGFHTVPEACAAHEIDEEAFVQALSHAIEES